MTIEPTLQMDNATFLDWVQGREGRHELAGGRVVTTPGGTRGHASIIANLLALLHVRLDRRRWMALTGFAIDVRPGTVRYPDIVVDRHTARRGALTAEAPLLVAEVLSPSTMKVDLGDKAAEYLQLPSLAAYLIFAQDEIKAWTFSRSGDTPFPPGPQIFAGADASIGIPALNLNLRLSDIYSGVELPH